jgi:hypothetical protein
MFDGIAQGTAWDSLALVHGRTLTHTPSGGAPATITAIWQEGQLLPGYLADGSQEISHGVLTVNPADVTVTLSDTFTIDSAVWAVVAMTPGIYTECQLERRVQKTVGGDNQLLKR